MSHRARILVVEDSFPTRVLVQHSLEHEGYEVECVPDGSTVMSSLLGRPPALVVLDVLVPGVDGFEILAQIRADERTRTLPVLMLTALDDARSTWRGWTAGCDYYLPKPFDIEHLVSVVGNLVSGAAA